MIARSNRMHGASAPPLRTPLAVVRALAAGTAAALLLLLLSTVIAYAQPDPGAAVLPLALVSLYLSAAVCGCTAGRASEHPVITGALAGASACLILFLLSLLFCADGASVFSAGLRILLYACLIPAAAAGAYIGRRRQKHPHHSIKKRRR